MSLNVSARSRPLALGIGFATDEALSKAAWTVANFFCEDVKVQTHAETFQENFSIESFLLTIS